MARPRISIAVPTFNRRDDVQACVDSLRRQNLSEFECFVVDNGPSTDGTGAALARIAEDDPRIVPVEMGPVGCVVARNEGFRRAGAELLLTLDDDVELVDPTTLDYIVAQFEADPGLGVLGLSEFYLEGRGKGAAMERKAPPGWRSAWRDTTLYAAGRINRWAFIGTRLHHLAFGQLHDVDHVRSSTMAIRRTAFEAVGGFFEPYTALGYGYRYETDLCVRIKRAGWRVAFSAREPQSYHKASLRTRGWDRSGMSDDYLYFTNRNNTFFFLRNYWGPLTGWLFLLWDIAVGNTSQPGLVRFLLYHRGFFGRLPQALRGKLSGWRMYWRYLPRH